MSRSWPGASHGRFAGVAGFAAISHWRPAWRWLSASLSWRWALAVPVLSLAWRNESSARWNEREQRLVAFQRAKEAQEQRTGRPELRGSQPEAHAKPRRTSEERERAEKALKFLVAAFRKPDPAADGRTLKVVDLLDWAVNDLEKSMNDQPLMKATLLNAIGETFSGLGLPPESLSVFERAYLIRRDQLGEDHPDTLESMDNLAMAYQDVGRLDKAIPILEASHWRSEGTSWEMSTPTPWNR